MMHIKKILVPSDYSPQAERAYSFGLQFARHFDSELHVLHVQAGKCPTSAGRPGDHLSVGTGRAAIDLGLPDESPGVPGIQMQVESSSVPCAIIDYAKDHEIDLIVMGGRSSTGLGLHHIGGVAGPVVRYARASVLTVRGRFPEHGLRRLLVPVDLSNTSRTNLAVAKELATSFGSEIDLLLILDERLYPTSFAQRSMIRLEAEVIARWQEYLVDFWEDVAGPAVPYQPHVRIGAPGPEILNFALQTAPDLITIGTHGKTGLRRLVLGSVAEAVVHQALVATLTIKSFGRPLLSNNPVRAEVLAVL